MSLEAWGDESPELWWNEEQIAEAESTIEALRGALVELCNAVEHGRSTREPWNKAMAVLKPNAQIERRACASAPMKGSTPTEGKT